MKVLYYILIALSIFSCKSQSKVVSFTNEKIRFEKYNTYQIINYKKGEQKISPQGEAFILKLENGISTEMTSRKYKLSTYPDMLVRYEMVSSIQVRNNNNNFNDPMNRSFNNSFNNNFYNTPFNNSTKHLEGILLIELKDRKSKKLIWQASLDLRYTRKTDKNEDLLLNAIQSIFQEYKYEAGNKNPIEMGRK